MIKKALMNDLTKALEIYMEMNDAQKIRKDKSNDDNLSS